MNLTPVPVYEVYNFKRNRIPPIKGKISSVIDEFLKIPYKAVRVDFSKLEFRNTHAAQASFIRSIQNNPETYRGIRAVIRGDNLYLVKTLYDMSNSTTGG